MLRRTRVNPISHRILQQKMTMNLIKYGNFVWKLRTNMNRENEAKRIELTMFVFHHCQGLMNSGNASCTFERDNYDVILG